MSATQGFTVTSQGPVSVSCRDYGLSCSLHPDPCRAGDKHRRQRWGDSYLNYRSPCVSPIVSVWTTQGKSCSHGVTANLPAPLQSRLKKPSFIFLIFSSSLDNLPKFCEETPHLELCKWDFQHLTWLWVVLCQLKDTSSV